MSASGYTELTLSARNIDDITAFALTIVLRVISFAHDNLPFDGGKRQPGAGGRQFQNIATLWEMNVVVVAFQIDQGEWDDGDWEQLIRVLRGKYLWIDAIDETGWKVAGTLQDGTDYDYWTSGTHTRLPKAVVVTWGASDMSIGSRAWRKFSMKFQAILPDVGVTI